MRTSIWPGNHLPVTALAFSLLLGSGAAPLSAEDSAAAALRARVTPEIIKKFCPLIIFHDQERFFPESIETLVKGATKYQVPPPPKDKEDAFDLLARNKIRLHESPLASADELGTLKGEEWRLGLDLSTPAKRDAILLGETGTVNGQKTVTAPWYVSVRVASDATYVELLYRELNGYNGPQTMREKGIGMVYAAPAFAEHQGDWEGSGIRIAPDLTTVIAVLTEAHGDVSEWAPEQVTWVDGSHASLRSAVNSHAIYNPRAINGTVIYLADAGPMDVIDQINDSGLQWKAWTLPDKYRPLRQIGKTASGPVGHEAWTDFHGRLGTYQRNEIQGPTYPDGSSLPPLKAAIATVNTGLTKALNALTSKIPHDSFEGAPPTGPGVRSPATWLEASPLPALTGKAKSAIFSRIDGGSSLVLSIDPSHPQGGLILASYVKGDPAQQWYVLKKDHDAYEIVNVKTERDLKTPGGQGQQLTTSLRPSATPCTLWTFGGDPANSCAIRPLATDDQNLNVLGDSPYKPGRAVGTWKWGHGTPNECWKIVAQ